MLNRVSAMVAGIAVGATMFLGGGVASAAVPSSGTCSGVVGVDGFGFSPAVVAPGESSAATLTATNCTALPQTVSETWAGRYSSSTGTGVPAGCPIIDPLLRGVTFAPHASAATSTTYLALPGCTADRLTVTVTLSQGGVQLGRVSADLLIR